MPDAVFPDTDNGREECHRLFGAHPCGVYFCGLFAADRPEWSSKSVRCLNRDERTHPENYCRLCPAGYMLELLVAPDRLHEDNRPVM